MAGQDDGWETITDPSAVPADIRKSLGVKGVRVALGLDADDDSRDGGKPVPQWAKKDFEKSLTPFSQIDRALSGFKDDYAGNTFTGDLENSIQGKFGSFGSSGQRDWWSQVRTADNQIRNELFGASLTAAEQKAYERTTISPDLDPKIVRENLKSRRDILAAATARQYKFLQAQGYSKDAIQAIAGDYVTTLDPAVKAERDAALQAAKGGDQQSGAVGVVAGGSGAPPAGPTGGGPGGGELVFNDEAPAQVAKPLDLKPEQTAAMQALVQSGASADAIAALAGSFGAQITPENAAALQKFYSDPKNRTVAPTVNVDNEVKAVDPGDGSVGAFARGITSNVPFSREIAAGIETLGDPSTTLSQNLDEEYGKRRFTEENNGASYTAGAIVGSLPLGFGEFAGAREAARAAGLAAVRSGTPVAEARMLSNRIFGTRTAIEAAGLSGLYSAGNADGSLADRAGAGVVGAAVGGGIGGAAAMTGSRFARALAARRASRPAAADEARRVAEDLRLNPPPSEAQLFDEAATRRNIEYLPADVPNATATRMASGVTNMTLGGIPLSEAATRTIGTAKVAKDAVAEGIGLVGDATYAGQAAQRGTKSFVKSSEQRGSQLYEAVPVENDRRALLTNTRSALTEITRGFDSNPALSRLWTENPRLKATLDALTVKTEPVIDSSMAGVGGGSGAQVASTVEGGQLSWGDLKRFRSIIGEISGQPSLADDGAQRASMRKLYGALSEDMRATAEATSPAAARAFNRANSFWRGRENRIESVLTDVLGNDLQKSPDAAFRAIEQMAKKKGGDPMKLARLVRSLPDDEANTVRATVLDRLGLAGNGRQDVSQEIYSPAEFMTQWSALSDRAKSILFGGEHKAAINDLVTVADGMKASQQFANTSRTSLGTNALATAATFWANPLLGLMSVGGQLGAGKMLGNPKFAKWLAKAPKKPNVPAQKAHAASLASIVRSEPAIAADVINLQRRLTEAFGSTPARLAAEERDRGSAPVERQNRQPAGPQQGLQP